MKTALFVGRKNVLNVVIQNQFRAYGFGIQTTSNSKEAMEIIKTNSIDIMIVYGYGDLFSNWIDSQTTMPPTIYLYLEGVDKTPKRSGIKLIPSNQSERIVDVALELLCPDTALILGLKPAVPTDPLEVALADSYIKPTRINCFKQAVEIVKKQTIKALIIYADGDAYVDQIEKYYKGNLPWIVYIKEPNSHQVNIRAEILPLEACTTPQTVINLINHLP